jgi:hypothetical protein
MSSERSSDLPKATHHRSDRIRIWSQVLWAPKLELISPFPKIKPLKDPSSTSLLWVLNLPFSSAQHIEDLTDGSACMDYSYHPWHRLSGENRELTSL